MSITEHVHYAGRSFTDWIRKNRKNYAILNNCTGKGAEDPISWWTILLNFASIVWASQFLKTLTPLMVLMAWNGVANALSVSLQLSIARGIFVMKNICALYVLVLKNYRFSLLYTMVMKRRKNKRVTFFLCNTLCEKTSILYKM